MTGVELVRCGSSDYILPWYFCRNGSGRFDLVEVNGYGTCYVASDLPGAMRERIGPEYKDGSTIYEGYFEHWVYWRLNQLADSDPSTIADLENDGWNYIGLTSEIFSIVDYPKCQKWAARYFEGGHGGLRVKLRHVLSAQRFGVALFGKVDSVPVDTQIISSEPIKISRQDMDDFTREMGIKVLRGRPRNINLHYLS
jgi:hypothetical protein